MQAELIAIHKAIVFAQSDQLPTRIKIFTDSFSSIQSLCQRDSRDHLVNAIQDLLLETMEQNKKIIFHWVKSHVGYVGYELADQHAQAAAESGIDYLECKPPWSYADGILKDKLQNEWQERCVRSNTGEWTRKMFPTITARAKAEHLVHTFEITQFLTGHGFFKAYLHRFHLISCPRCPCGIDQTLDNLVRRRATPNRRTNRHPKCAIGTHTARPLSMSSPHRPIHLATGNERRILHRPLKSS